MVLTAIQLEWIHSHHLVMELKYPLQLLLKRLNLIGLQLRVRLKIIDKLYGHLILELRDPMEVLHEVRDEEVAIVDEDALDVFVQIQGVYLILHQMG